MSEAITHDARFEAAKTVADKMLDAASDETSHSLILEALLLAYITVAKTHACCTQGAANSALAASMRLASYAAERPAGTSVH